MNNSFNFSHIPHGFYETQMREFFSQFGTITNLRYIYTLLAQGNPVWTQGRVIVSPTVYPLLVVNYDFSYISRFKVDPLNLESQNQS